MDRHLDAIIRDAILIHDDSFDVDETADHDGGTGANNTTKCEGRSSTRHEETNDGGVFISVHDGGEDSSRGIGHEDEARDHDDTCRDGGMATVDGMRQDEEHQVEMQARMEELKARDNDEDKTAREEDGLEEREREDGELHLHLVGECFVQKLLMFRHHFYPIPRL